jgi:hypothetical protein
VRKNHPAISSSRLLPVSSPASSNKTEAPAFARFAARGPPLREISKSVIVQKS